ncbi:DUF1405 domain-containing protein [Halomarina halobia]|uniref:DUF1405 domain-containing protein n=1 Tax=Halomarina halobia TaxID=3033386 RepID=A0ABD6A7M8_9EURY|nr:DUF1405 domain-containing protein [Halomarina sp. PSR21]
MSIPGALGSRAESVAERLRAFVREGDVPEREPLPRYVAPLPALLEDLGLRLAWLVVGINLVGTAFGFWYYAPQFSLTPVEMWPFVPDSPLATLLIALSIAAWKLGRNNEVLNALAFFGCIKLGLWTPYVLVAFFPEWGYAPWDPMYNFLFWSHLAMVVQAFVVHRYAAFPVWAVAVATLWYVVDLVVDYFYPVVGDPHHTLLPLPDAAPWLGVTALQVAALGAVLFTILPVFLALATRVEKLQLRLDGR